MPERISELKSIFLKSQSSRLMTGTWTISMTVMENCLASGCHIDIVETLLNLLRASREGDWELHLSAIRQMIPWCFAYANLNYLRYLSADLSGMAHLEEDQPEGGFSVQMGDQNPFGRIPIDQACEETVNTAGAPRGSASKQER